MVASNPYFRALVFSIGMAIAVCWRLLPENDGDSRRTVLELSLLGVAGLVSTLLVGTFSSRGKKAWSWPTTGFASLGCWLVVLYAIFLLQKTFTGR
jgi:hypothetical protein